jgi:hypothetical protein
VRTCRRPALFWGGCRDGPRRSLKPKPNELNDYRPAALTSVMIEMHGTRRSASFDCMQWPHPRDRPNAVCVQIRYAGTDDAYMWRVLAHLLHMHWCSHLNEPKTYARISYIDFSSAFNITCAHSQTHCHDATLPICRRQCMVRSQAIIYIYRSNKIITVGSISGSLLKWKNVLWGTCASNWHVPSKGYINYYMHLESDTRVLGSTYESWRTDSPPPIPF